MAPSQAPNADNARTVCVAQVNILAMPEGEDYRYDFLRHNLSEINADIVCLQEVRNPEKLKSVLADAGYHYTFFTPSAEAYDDHVGIASRIAFDDASIVDFDFLDEPRVRRGVIAEFNDADTGHMFVYAGHFAWNMMNEHLRVRQAQQIAGLADTLTRGSKTEFAGDTIFLIGADLNASDTSQTYRYLTGQQAAAEQELPLLGTYALESTPEKTPLSTFFVDAYDIAHNGPTETHGNSVPYATTEPAHNHWGRLLAESHGTTFPELSPDRRIDFLLSYDWVYGKRGCPLNYQRFGDPAPEAGFDKDMSDHYGICTEILL